ncbi:sulfate respiration complex protein HmcD [Desulfovibrio cuneatus]|nr:hypothetical protein [Desulfovibrio cuneatus]
MDTVFYSYHDFMLATKTITYVLMGLGLFGLLGFWLFLTGRDEPIRKY